MRETAGATPPGVLVFAAILSVQLGAAIAKNLFPAFGTSGTVLLRVGLGALVLLAAQRPELRGHSRRAYGAAILFGVAIAVMNSSFYAALARLPLGIAVTLEFIGPLGVAVFGSRRRLDVVWGLLAAAGVLLLAPIGGASLDPLGVGLALLAGAGWAAYILLNVRVGRAFPRGSGLVVAMLVAAILVMPLGAPKLGPVFDRPQLLLAGFALALLSSAIPFALEHAALKRLPARIFGVMMSIEPAVAALVGLVFLGQALGLRGILALVCVSIATAGSALGER